MTVTTQLLNAGNLLLSSGLPGRARAVFDRLLELEPGNHEAQLGVADCLLQQGEPARAVEVLQTLVGDDPSVWRLLAVAALEAGDGGVAKAAFVRLQTMTDETPDQLLLALAAYLDGDADLCRAYVEAALRQDPQRDAALGWARKLESLDTKHAFLVDLARHHLRRGDVPKALRALDGAAANGDSAEHRSLKGKALILTADFEQALRYLQESVGLYPDDPDLRSELGAVLLLLGRIGEAAAELDRVLFGPAPPQSAFVRRGQVAVLGEDAETATRFGEAARTNDPIDEEAWLVSAQAASLRGRIAEVRPLADHAVALNPADPSSWAEASRLIRGSDPGLADRYALRALDITGSTEAIEPAQLGSIDSEVTHLEGIVAGRPEFGFAFGDRVVINEHLGLIDRALVFQEADWRHSPDQGDDPDFHVRRGALLAAVGATKGAAASFGLALTLDPDHGAARDALAALETLTND